MVNLPALASKNINRAEVVDQNFIAYVTALANGHIKTPQPSSMSDQDLLSLFDCQLQSRQMDLMARIKRLENKVFYTIGSSGHEGNALLGYLSRVTDPAYLHYRSGGFMAARSLQGGVDFIRDTALSFAASCNDPASGGRHKVWGSKPLWVQPQTSTIASHLPKAVGAALAIAHSGRVGHKLEIPDDSIVICSFGDASANHSTAQGAFNMAQWASHQGLPVPIVFVCEDNGIGISVKSPQGWIANNFSKRHGLDYRAVDGLDLSAGYDAVKAAIDDCRKHCRPVFLHLQTTRLMGHAGTDFEVDYRRQVELEAEEARDPLLRTAELLVARGLLKPQQILDRYQVMHQRCLDEADQADNEPRLIDLNQVIAPLAPQRNAQVIHLAQQSADEQARLKAFDQRLPELRPRKHMAVLINWALTDLLTQYSQSLVFGEDVAQKGGVYTVTKGLQKRFGGARVFNTLLDEQSILGLAQGYAALGYLPIPEIQYLAYFHNACDQIRGEACSLQFFSNNQFSNPMVIRIASLGYQKGFGGHFHNDNSITALRDIPGLVIACPSRGDDAVLMLRTLMALAKTDGRVSAFLEPIALYMTKDLYQEGDSGWCFAYPEAGKYIALGQGRVYFPSATDLLIITYGNGVPMSLQAAQQLVEQTGKQVRILDLRWLQPLNEEQIAGHAEGCKNIIVFDEGRHSGGVGEGVIAALQRRGLAGKPMKRIAGVDSYIPLGDAANLILPSVDDLLAAAKQLLAD